MMNIEVRIEKLALQVKLRRAQGYVKNWSDEIKQESLYLSKQVCIGDFCRRTKIHLPTLIRWRKQIFKQTPKAHFKTQMDEHKITRVVVGSQEIRDDAKNSPLAIVTKGGVELRLYCSALASKIAEKLIL